MVILAEYHALVHEALKRLRRVDKPEVEQHLVPKTGIEQVEDGVLGAADIEIDRRPVVDSRCGGKSFRVMRVEVAQVIPA